MDFAALRSVVIGRLCCKSPFPLGIKNSPGCRRDLHVKMWGISLPDDKLTGDLGNAFEAAEIGGRWSDVFWRENCHRAISDFCNSIGTKRTNRAMCCLAAFGGKAECAGRPYSGGRKRKHQCKRFGRFWSHASLYCLSVPQRTSAWPKQIRHHPKRKLV